MQSLLQRFRKVFKYWRLYTAIFTPLVFALLFTVSTSKETRCGYVMLVMAVYWMTESMPLAVTSLIPAFAFPLLGILSSSEVSLTYMKETNMLFLGGLIVATAVEHSNLHKRIALFVILHIGQSPRRLMAGFMLTTMFLSMWISNTASTAMMVPIVSAILMELNKTSEWKDVEMRKSKNVEIDMNENPEPRGNSHHLTANHNGKEFTLEGKDNPGLEITEDDLESPSERTEIRPAPAEMEALKDMYFLAVAYGANVGGTGSLTGTGPNLVVKGVLDSSFNDPTGLNFASWMAFNVPGMILCTVVGYFWLQFMFIGFGSKSILTESSSPEKEEKIKHLIRKQYKELGSITFHEKAVLTVFVSLVLLWLFREPGFMPGWADLFKIMFPDIKIGDGPPAILAAFLLFVLPASPNFWPSSKHTGPSPMCLNWEIVHKKVPWGIILLLGGGFAMAKACNDSGLSLFIGEKLNVLDSLPVGLSVLIVSTATALATEITSNTATASIIMPILKELALKICVNPLYLMLPAAVCCSYAFMLPVATPPNAIVFGAADMSTKVMMKAGFVMNFLCVIVINVMINTLGVAMFSLGELPPWVNSTTSGNYSYECVQNVDEFLS